MGVVTVWEVECTKGPGHVQLVCVAHSCWYLLGRDSCLPVKHIRCFLPGADGWCSMQLSKWDGVCPDILWDPDSPIYFCLSSIKLLAHFVTSSFSLFLEFVLSSSRLVFYSFLLLWPGLLWYLVHNDDSWMLCWTPTWTRWHWCFLWCA